MRYHHMGLCAALNKRAISRFENLRTHRLSLRKYSEQLAICCVLVLVFVGLIPVGHAASSKNERLGAGDLIFLQADSHKALNRKFQLDKEGSLVIPYIGKINLKGVKIAQAEQLIRRKLAGFFRSLQSIKIRILSRKKYVSISGWVKRPGRYLLNWKDGLEVLLGKANGLRKGARIDGIRIHFLKGPTKTFNLLQYYQTGKGSIPFLKRGSSIFVPVGRVQSPEIGTKMKQVTTGQSRIAVLGAVKNPGVFPAFKKINLLQALAMASGPISKSGWQEVLITPPKGRTFFFDLKHYLRDPSVKKTLPMLTPGSVVIVPFSPLGRSQRGPVHVLGEVAKPGVWRGSVEKDLTGWLARSKGPTSNADLTSVSVIYKGSNFTINQLVNVNSSLKNGHLNRLPPTPKGRMVIFVPKKETKSQTVQDTQTFLQIAISVTSVVTSVVLLTLTLAK